MQYRIWYQDTYTKWKDSDDGYMGGNWRLAAETLIRRENLPINIGDIVEIEIRNNHNKKEVMTYRFNVKPQFIWIYTFDPKDLP